jgi:hypothetical protein
VVHAAKTRAASSRTSRRSISNVEVTALVARDLIPDQDFHRIADVLAGAGIGGLTPAKIILSRAAAKRVASGRLASVQATIVAGQAREHQGGEDRSPALDRALQAARLRGDTFKQARLADPDMLSTAEMAERLGMSEEGVRLKRKRHEVLGLELAKRGIRYPAWQILENQQLLPVLSPLFDVLGGDPWTIYRFLLQHHAELGGARALDALRHGRTDGVMAAAENVAGGAFS